MCFVWNGDSQVKTYLREDLNKNDTINATMTMTKMIGKRISKKPTARVMAKITAVIVSKMTSGIAMKIRAFVLKGRALKPSLSLIIIRMAASFLAVGLASYHPLSAYFNTQEPLG